MQNIKVTVGVEFTSGAKIELTKEQNTKVTEFVSQVVFGAPIREKKVYVRRSKKYQKWTKEEDAMIRNAMNLPLGKARSREYKRISAQTNRSKNSISQRATALRRRQKQDLIDSINDFDFLSAGR